MDTKRVSLRVAETSDGRGEQLRRDERRSEAEGRSRLLLPTEEEGERGQSQRFYRLLRHGRQLVWTGRQSPVSSRRMLIGRGVSRGR